MAREKYLKVSEIISGISNPIEQRKAILANVPNLVNRVEALRKNPESMITDNMTGKMENMISLSSSCCTGESCRKNIAAAIKEVKRHSKLANDILDLYFLPSDDKRHISGTKAATMLVNMGVNVCICLFCYADGQQDWQHGGRFKFAANGEYLQELHDMSELPVMIGGYNDTARIEAMGDCNSVNQARNYFRICHKPENSGVTFGLWTKNPGYYWKAMLLEGGKPKNLVMLLSSRYINKQEMAKFEYFNRLSIKTFGYPMFDHVFTVFLPDYAIDNNIDMNCCLPKQAGKKILPAQCMSCKNSCYDLKEKTVERNEVLR